MSVDELDHGSVAGEQSSSGTARARRNVLRRDDRAARGERRAALLLLVRREKHVAQPLRAPGAMMDAADVHRRARRRASTSSRIVSMSPVSRMPGRGSARYAASAAIASAAEWK